MPDFETTVLRALESLDQEVRRLGVLHEETSEKIDQIIETISPEMQKNNAQDATLADHENRISILETTQKAAA